MRPLDPSLATTYEAIREARRKLERNPLGRFPTTDRRRNTRFPIANTQIGNHAASGRVVDLSRGGMAIECHDALSPGRVYDFRLTIGDHTEMLTARLLWCRLRDTRRLPSGDVLPVYRAGIERIAPPPEAPGDSSATGL